MREGGGGEVLRDPARITRSKATSRLEEKQHKCFCHRVQLEEVETSGLLACSHPIQQQ